MQYIKPDVQTICVGQAASAAAVLLAAGAQGKRFVLPHARVLHPPAARWCVGPGGRHRDPGQGDRPRCASSLDEILAHHTGQTVEKVAKDTDRDFIMSAAEAKEYGIVDEVITNRELAAVACRGRGRAERPSDRREGGTSWRSSVTAATC